MRSVEYYKSDVGKVKKKVLNGRRKKEASTDSPHINREEKKAAKDAGLDKQIVQYIKTIVELISGIRMDFYEVLEMVKGVMRQHSIDRRRRFLYLFNKVLAMPP
jgi:hypothetical protein